MSHIDVDLYVPDQKESNKLKEFLRELTSAGTRQVTEDSHGIIFSEPKPIPKHNVFIFKGFTAGGKDTLTCQIREVFHAIIVGAGPEVNSQDIKRTITAGIVIVDDYSPPRLSKIVSDNINIRRYLRPPVPITKLIAYRTPIWCRELYGNAQDVIPIANYIIVTRKDCPDLESMGTVIHFPYTFPERINELRDEIVNRLIERLPKELAKIVANFRY